MTTETTLAKLDELYTDLNTARTFAAKHHGSCKTYWEDEVLELLHIIDQLNDCLAELHNDDMNELHYAY